MKVHVLRVLWLLLLLTVPDRSVIRIEGGSDGVWRWVGLGLRFRVYVSGAGPCFEGPLVAAVAEHGGDLYTRDL